LTTATTTTRTGRLDRTAAEAIARDVADLTGKARTQAVRRWADLYGVTPASITRWLRKVGCRTRSVNRRRGQTRVSETDLLKLANAIAKTTTAKDGKSLPLLTVERAAGILARNGCPSLASVSTSRLATLLRERGLHRKGIREMRTRPPRVRVATAHPNQVHVLDASHCVRFFFGRHGLTYRQDLDRTVYKNKPAKVRAIYNDDRLVWRLAILDHTTTAFYVRYVEMPGEHPAATVEFLIDAWREKPDPRYEFHGVPEILFSDKGIATAGDNSPVRTFAENLGVRVVDHAAGNPAAKGAIEGFMAYWERYFEGPLALEPARSVAELNAWAFEEAITLQTTRAHRRHGRTRFEAWRSISQEHLRELPRGETAARRLMDLATYKPTSRKVTTDGLVRFAGREWRVPLSDLHGRHVLVYRDFWKAGSIQVALEGAAEPVRYECAPVEVGAWGFREDAVPFGEYRRLPDTAQQREVKRALKVELGPVAVYSQERPAAETPEPLAVPRRGEEMVPASEPAARMLSAAKARDRLYAVLDDMGVSIDTEMWAVIDERWPGGEPVAEEAVQPLADELARLKFGQAGEERTA